MAECPYIYRSSPPDSFNKPLEYQPEAGGDVYIYYEHDDGFGVKSLVQFCQVCGRKRDVFQCYNESEWKTCGYYQMEEQLKGVRPEDD